MAFLEVFPLITNVARIDANFSFIKNALETTTTELVTYLTHPKMQALQKFFRVFKKIFCLEFLLLEGAKNFCRRIRHKSLETPPLYSDNENQYTGLKVQVKS